MASLQELLVEEGFERHKKQTKGHPMKDKFRDRRRAQDESIVLPIYVCHERSRSFDAPKQKSDGKAYSQNGSVLSSSSRRGASESGSSFIRSVDEGFLRRNEPQIDEFAITAVVSILGGYVGQYLRDDKFRETTRAKCLAFLATNKDLDNALLEKMELGIENVERLVEDHQEGHQKELSMKSVQYCIRLLSSTISSLKSTSSKKGSASNKQSSHVVACAHLYLSIVYKVHRSNRISARHLLQVFCDSPLVGRTHLLPEVWEHLFLPHLLHIKIWYAEELESLSNLMYFDFKETKIKALDKAYNDQMDSGTEKFALYYKEWLKDGAKAPAVPFVSLPSTPNRAPLRRRYSDSFTSHSSRKSSLYRAIFGPILERQATKLNDIRGDSNHHSSSEEQQKFSTKEHEMDPRSLGRDRSSSISQRKGQAELWLDYKKSDYFRLLGCRNDESERSVREDSILRIASIGKDKSKLFSLSNDLSRAMRTICTSDSLTECETAIRLISKAWLDSHGDPTVENAVSNTQVIEAMLDVLSASNNDEILELAISMLAKIVTQKELNAKIILNFDPQLDIFMRLLRNNSLFLKAAVLLYLAKPKAKQMIAMEWIPLVLRVLEFGDQLQTLVTIQCSPQVAAYYFLDQLLNCFDKDKNMENAGYVVSLGGLSLLLRRMEIGDTNEMKKAASIIYSCILADGSCRLYLARNLNKECLISLLVHRDQTTPRGLGVALLTEIFCLNRHHQRIELLNELVKGWGRMNTLHILLVYLRRAKPKERPLVAAILLQLDLLGDPNLQRLECSVYREEAVEGIVKALDCQVLNEKVQEQTAKALIILSGHFSCTGEPVAEKWLLKQAGFDDNSLDSFSSSSNKFAVNNYTNLLIEDEAAGNWQMEIAMVLLKSGRRDFLVALSDSITNGIPCLARASLVTISWISSFLQTSAGDNHLQSLALSTLAPQLLEALNYDKTLEERVLACFSLLSLLKGSDYLSRLKTMINGELINEVQKLSQVTWTAKELISIITSN